MDMPWFYLAHLPAGQLIALDENAAKHAVQVLRMQEGDSMLLTDGKGQLCEGKLAQVQKKKCLVQLNHCQLIPRKVERKVAIGISPLKNASRFEWFLEKATEMGVAEIFPLLCHRTVRSHFRMDRMQAICVSAMLQSQQTWLPILHMPLPYQDLMQRIEQVHYHHRWIAHCSDLEKHHLSKVLQPGMTDSLLLIGPEGDFTNEEIILAETHNFSAVALGDTRLRTETAGVAATALLCLMS
jgi:16S rRNA (uracil1498-N3)-methyltransferase